MKYHFYKVSFILDISYPRSILIGIFLYVSTVTFHHLLIYYMGEINIFMANFSKLHLPNICWASSICQDHTVLLVKFVLIYI